MADDLQRSAPTRSESMPIPRKIAFAFPDDIDPQWIPGKPELAAMMNGASLTMPYLEPFLIRSVREASQQINDEWLSEQGRAFNTQEQHHFQAHRRFNELLKSKRYPELEQIEREMQTSYARLSTRSLRTKMAYTAGFESMTLGVTKWLIEKRVELFKGADPRVVSFVLWHMVEETEHKCVAYDIYQATFGHGFRAYLARALGVFHGSFDVMRYSMCGYKAILQHEGLWSQLRSRLRLAGHLSDFIRHVGPYLLRAALPGHSPRREKDPQWVLDWIAGHGSAASDQLPLLDTQAPFMPVPFPSSVGPFSRIAE
jgi:predicted metal-dependent hydrolase